MTFYLENDVGEYLTVELLTVLCSLFQLSIFIVFLTSELFPEQFQWMFATYIVLTMLPKLGAVYAIRKNKKTHGENSSQFSQSRNIHHFHFDQRMGLLQKADYYMFAWYVLSVSVVLWICVLQDNKSFEPMWMKHVLLPARWGPGWQLYHSMNT